MSNRFPAIPDFTNEPHSMAASMRPMKEIVEQLGGLRKGVAGASLTFVQGSKPMPVGALKFKTGDLWINPETNKLSWWTGVEWKQFS